MPDIAVFSTHYLREGGASAAANADVADRLFHGMADGSLFQLRMVILTSI